MVGMNRRFAPHTQRAKELLSTRTQPVALSVTINAGAIPADHWLHDPAVGGGRLVGEGCHFIDLLTFLAGSKPVRVQTTALQGASSPPLDSASIALSFADGSVGVVQYWSNGPKSFPKERVEIFSEGRCLVIDNWRELRAYDWPGASKLKTRQDKGHSEELKRFIASVTCGGDPLIPYDELHAVAAATLAAAASAGSGQAIDLAD